MEGEDLATTVLTCEGDITDPTFPFRLQYLVTKLQHLISDEEKPFKVTKVEPWNSVRVTFNIPQEAAQRLRQLAERGDRVLRELGILSVQIEGDQVITLTLAGQFNEPQEIVLRKSAENQGNVASVSFNLPSSEPVPGPSTSEPARKSISQLLGHIVGGATTAAVTANTPSRTDASMKSDSSLRFRSPNVIAPSSKGPIPFPPAAAAATATVPTANTSHSAPLPSTKQQQPGFRPFPFASMTHAMNTKNAGTSPQFQSVVHVQSTNSRIAFTTSSPLVTTSSRNASTSPTSSSATSPSASGPSQPVVNPVLQKLSRSVSNPIFNNIVSRVTAPNAVAVTSRANVALSSPLLVNLLQSETSTTQPHNKLMPPPALSSNQAPKRKRKPRKPKEKQTEDGTSVSSPTFSPSPSPPSTPSGAGLRSPVGFEALTAISHSFNVPITSMPLSPPSHPASVMHSQAQGPTSVSSIHPHSHIPPTAANIHPQAQGQPPVSLHSQVQMPPVVPSSHRHIQGHQTVPTIHRPAPPGHPSVPNIHPQAEGQPQVHTGNLPLHTHIPVGVPAVSASASLQSYAMSGPRGISLSTRLLFTPNRDNTPVTKATENTVRETVAVKSSEKNSTPSSTSATSTPESNPFPSPPPSAEGKTKHLINPFTGQLEPMPPSDEEEEEESIGSLPPFPDFDIDTSENGQSERSLSDGGKDNISSDTDSGISKSHTDISQSSTDCGPVQSSKDNKKPEVTKAESVTPTASVTSGPGEKLKLRLKIDPKTIRESKEIELKEKRKENASQFSQRIDVAVVSIPGLKKGGSSLSSTPGAPEPRVPPLHISLRGPNAAVVVSPRKDDLKSKCSLIKEDHSAPDTVIKSIKKARSPRSARTAEFSGVSSSLVSRISDSSEKRCKGNNVKEPKKAKDDFWNQNVKNMSGGGIVEMSEKTALNRVTNYVTYADRQSVGSMSLQRKAPPILPISTKESCKSDVITLTSCVTGETVSIHTAAHAKSQLPSQLSSAAEMASLVSVINTRAPTKGLAPNVQITQSVNERTPNSVFSGMGNSVQDKTIVDYAVSQPQICKDNSLLGARKSPQNMQNIYLPHGPSAQTECKSIVQKTTPSDQIQSTSASSVSIVSAVPLSSHSTSFSTQSVCNVVSTLPKEVSVFSDSILLGEKEKLNSSEELKNSAICDRLHHPTNIQCNTPSLHLTATPVDNVKSNPLIVSRDIVQSEKTFISTLSESISKDKSVIREVQMNAVAAVNNEQTVNHMKISDEDMPNFNEKESVTKPVVSSSSVSVKQVFLEENQMCKSSTFSNHTALCESPVTSCSPVTKREILKDMDASEKGLCIIEVKNPNPPIAQIITVDNLPIQSRVIEVPSLQTSPAVPKALAKSGLAVEVSSVPSLIPSRCGAFIPSRSVVMLQEQEDVLTVSSQISSDLAHPKLLASTNSSAVQKSNALLGSGNEVLFNHVNLRKHATTSECVDSDRTEQNSSAVPSEESSMDSIDEERKRCMMLLSEVPTSTPGPPKTDQDQLASTSTPCENMKSNSFSEICSSSVSSSDVEKRVIDVAPASQQKKETQDEHREPDSSKTASEDALFEGVSKEKPLKDASHPEVKKGSSEVAKLTETGTPSDCPLQLQPTSTSSPQVSEDTPSETCSRITQSSNASKLECNSSVAESNTSEPCDTFHTAKTISLESTSKSENLSTPDQIPPEVCPKKEPVTSCEQTPAVNTATSSSVVTSLLSQGRYLSPETSTGGRVRLIFKGSGQHSMLSASNSPTSVVVPLNSSKTVPIKLVTLPGGASGLSVRSTSNPAVVEIIGPKSSSSHSSPSSGNPHSSSPVRLVVSKVSPGVSSVTQSGTSGVRNRVVVKSVVVTGTSSSIKIVSATKGTVCTTTCPVFPSSSVIATSSAGGHSSVSLPSSIVSSSCNPNPSSAEDNPAPENSGENLVTSSSMHERTSANQERVGSVSSTTASEVNMENSALALSQEIKVESSILNAPESSILNTAETSNAESTAAEKRIERDKSPMKDCPSQVQDEKEDRTIKNSSQCETNVSSSENGPSANLECMENMPKNISEDSSSVHVLNKLCVDSCGTNEQNTNSAIVKSSVNISDDTGVSDLAKQCKMGADISEIPECVKSSCSDFSGSLETCSEEASEKAYPKTVEQCSTSVDRVSPNDEVDTPVSVETAQNSSEKCNIQCSNVKLEPSPSSGSICENVNTLSPQETKSESTASENAHLAVSCVEENVVEKESIRPFQEPKIENDDEGDLINLLGQEISDCDDITKQAEQSLVDISLVYSKPLKRKCSENAAELIKACMGVEDSPKRIAVQKSRPSDEVIEKLDGEKLEDHMRMNLRVRRDDSSRKIKGLSCNSDYSSDEEMALSELMNKSRARERQGRARLCNKDLLLEPNNCRPGRRRSGSSESRHGDEPKGRTVRENNKRDMKKEETIKKVPERTKRGNTQDQLIGSRVIGQRSGRVKEQEMCKEENTVNAKRKTRGTDTVDVVPVKRRRYSKDGHR